MILYPTETLYALGVNALEYEELQRLYTIKGRDSAKVSSWLVRSSQDIEQYAQLDAVSRALIAAFLPGPMTLVLRVKPSVPADTVSADGTIGFRISSDPAAQAVIADFYTTHNAPLTCTSANLSGLQLEATVEAIGKQFADKVAMIDTIVDDGVREGAA